MSIMETNIARSTVTRRENDSMSVPTQETIRGTGTLDLFPDGREGISEHFPVSCAFEEDLRHSWVYQRVVARGSRPFSIATSTQLTQSWSILSGLSLSAISNISVCALPIYKRDLKNSDLYIFNSGGPVAGWNEQPRKVEISPHAVFQSPKAGVIPGPPSSASPPSEPDSPSIRIFKSRGKSLLTSRLRARIPAISEPVLIGSSSTQLFYDRSMHPNFRANAPSRTPQLELTPTHRPPFTYEPRSRPLVKLNWPLSEPAAPCVETPAEEEGFDHGVNPIPLDIHSIPFLQPVSWLAACSIACDIPISATGSGIPYLNYKPGEVSGSPKNSEVSEFTLNFHSTSTLLEEWDSCGWPRMKMILRRRLAGFKVNTSFGYSSILICKNTKKRKERHWSKSNLLREIICICILLL
jgi:hypothetical protein